MEAPQLLNPVNNSSTASSKLSWQSPSYPLYNSNPFRIQVDDSKDFSSINKDYYTANLSYTPTLSPGTWYWRVKAKDSTGSWSDWSTIWSFILSDSAINSSPSPEATPSFSPTPSSSSQTNIFTVSNIPSQINVNQSFNINVNLFLQNNPNTLFYLKGAFIKPGSSNYFGLTNTANGWAKNGATASSQKSITTDGSGNWSGTLETKPDPDDYGYQGSGNYIFKVARYNSSGSNLTWSDESNITITGNVTISSSTPSPAFSPKIATNLANSAQTKETTIKRRMPVLSPKDSTVAGIATKSATNTLIKSERKFNLFFIAAGVLVILGSIIYIAKSYK